MCIELVKLLLLLSLIIAIACTCTNISHGHQQEVLYGPLPYSRLPYTPSKFWMFILPLTLGLIYFYLFCDNTIFAWSDTMTTIYFIAQFCVASIREWRLFNSGRWRNPLPQGRWSGCRHQGVNPRKLCHATDTKVKESDPFADVEEDKDGLEENELVLEDCYSVNVLTCYSNINRS